MTDFRALCAELLDEFVYHTDWSDAEELKDRARAALADGPAVPTVMEIVELADEIEAAGLGQVDLVRAALTRWGNPAPPPVAVSERLPVGVEQALIKAECALSDIAEGEPEENEGDADALLQWAEQRAATALSRIRPVMRLHGILTSEWPPLPAHALPVPGQEVAG